MGFCMLRLTLDATFRHNETGTDHRRTVAVTDIKIDHQVGGAELVLERDEDNALRGARPLPQQHDARQTNGAAFAGRAEPPVVVVALIREYGPQQRPWSQLTFVRRTLSGLTSCASATL
jgi:hypothetical protein